MKTKISQVCPTAWAIFEKGPPILTSNVNVQVDEMLGVAPFDDDDDDDDVHNTSDVGFHFQHHIR